MDEDRNDGIQIRIGSWSDVISLVTLLSILVGAVAGWFKLQSDIQRIELRQIEHTRQLGNGILPRAEERLLSIDKRVEALERARKTE